MKQEGIRDEVIGLLKHIIRNLLRVKKGFIGEDAIRPPSENNLIDYQQIKHLSRTSILKNTVVIKLNGGLEQYGAF